MTIGPYAPCCPLKYPCMCIYMLGSSWLAGSTRIIDWFSSSIKRLRKCWASSWRHKNGIVHSCMLWVVSLGAPFKHFRLGHTYVTSTAELSPLVPRGRLNWEKVCGHWSCRLVTGEAAMLKADGIFWKLKAIADIWRLCVCVPSVGHQPWVWERCVLMVEVGAERKVTLPLTDSEGW